jgi:hypothetical protein
MDTTDRQHVLRDAKTLAWYAARNGKLPPGCNIFELIEKFDGDDNPPTSLIVQLQAEMDVVSRSIAPMTLRHLLQRGTVIGYVRHVLSSITPFALGLLTLLLTLYLAFQSSQLNQADTAVREYQAWVDQQPREKLYDAWKMYRYERVLNLKGPPLAQLDAYHKLEDDARQLVDKGAAIQGMLGDAGTLLYIPRFFEHLGPSSFQKFIRSINGDEQYIKGVGENDLNVPKNLPPGPGVRDTNDAAQQGAAGFADFSSQLDCKEGVLLPDGKSADASAKQNLTDIDTYTNSIECFFQRLHISGYAVSHAPWIDIYRVKAKINLLVTWLLPGLYGLLGACVFLLRELVLTRGSRISQDKRIVSMLLLLLRVALGGLAGIIIGWFWIPTPAGNAPTAIVPISSIPFGLAFMAGFSIDTLFSLLDRVNRTIDSSDVSARNSVEQDARVAANRVEVK